MKTSIKRVMVFLLVGATLGAIVYFVPAFLDTKPTGPAIPHLTTGGSSVVHFSMDKWGRGFSEKYKNKDKEPIFVDYASKGSKAGIENMLDRKYDIGFTHAPMSEAQKKQAKGEVLHIPVGISAIVPIYNVKELNDKPPLNLTGDVLARIYRGEITRWDHKALQDINPDVKLPPDKEIKVVYRKGPSGTTYVFTEYLAEVNSGWKNKIGDTMAVPEDKTAAKLWHKADPDRSEGMVAKVRATEGSIGYVEVIHARRHNIAYAAVENKDSIAKKDFKDKVFIHAAPENITAAAREIVRDIPDDLTFNPTNRAGPKSYPICAPAWAVCYQAQPADRLKLVADFLTWVTHEGQLPENNAFSYAAVAKPTLNKKDGTITSLALTSGGFGYKTAPKVEITGGGGQGATATATVKNRQVDEIKITSGGTGYTSAPTVTFESPEQELLFAPLPEELVQRIDARLKTLKAIQ